MASVFQPSVPPVNEIAGTAFYSDRYTKTDDGWRIAHTGYMRVFEEHRAHSTLALHTFSSRFDPR